METLAPIIQSYPIAFDPNKNTGGSVYDPKRAERCIRFIESACTHVEGELAGKPFIVPPWQRAIVSSLFGFVRPDGTRRINEAFCYVPRKNAKTFLMCGVALFCLVADGEEGPQVYSIAAEKEQAGIMFRVMSGMIKNNAMLTAMLKVMPGYKVIEYPKKNGIYKALSAEAYSKHGLNVSCCLSDEVHCQPDRELIDTMQTAMKARRSPLMFHATTADYWRPESPCNKLFEYASKVRDGLIDDPSFLPALWYATRDHDWKDEALWRSVNPNFGASINAALFKKDATRAENEADYRNEFLRLSLNVVTDSRTAWLNMDAWKRCETPFDLKTLDGQPCYAGLDLSSTTDTTSLVLFFPATRSLLCWAWIPEDGAREREKVDRVPYLRWKEDGFISTTPGNRIDHLFIRQKVRELSKQYKIQAIAYDTWNSLVCDQMYNEDGMPMQAFRQGSQSMNGPCKCFEADLMKGNFRVHPNPVLRWYASNIMVTTDDKGNICPSKSHSTGRIDGLVAAIMAYAVSGMAGVKTLSAYDNHGIEWL